MTNDCKLIIYEALGMLERSKIEMLNMLKGENEAALKPVSPYEKILLDEIHTIILLREEIRNNGVR